MRGITTLFLALLLVSCTPTVSSVSSSQSVTASPSPTSVLSAYLSAKPSSTLTPPPPRTTPPPPPGFGFINVRLVDEAGKPHGYGLIGPEVFAYPARKDICSVLPRTGMGTVQDTLVESWRHANRDGLAQLTVKIPGAYFIFVGGDEHSFWWDGQKNCLNATPLQVDGTINLDVVY